MATCDLLQHHWHSRRFVLPRIACCGRAPPFTPSHLAIHNMPGSVLPLVAVAFGNILPGLPGDATPQAGRKRSSNIRHRTWMRQGRSFVQCLGDASDAPDRSDKYIRRQRIMPDAASVAVSRCESPTCRRCLCSSSLRGPGTQLEATHARAALLRLGRADTDPRVEDALLAHQLENLVATLAGRQRGYA